MGDGPVLTPLFVDHSEALGGAERSLLLTLGHLDRGRFRPHLACPGGALAKRAAELGVPVHPVAMARLRRSAAAPLDWLGGARALAALARRAGAHLLVANTVRAALYAAPAARLAGLPLVWHMRDFWLSEAQPRVRWLDTAGKRALCRVASAVLANSQATAAHLPCPGGVTVIHNGIEVDAFDPALDGSAFRAQLGIPSAAPLMGMVGRLRPWKGQARFLRLAAGVASVLPEARFVLVGGSLFEPESDYAGELRRLAASLGLAERVTFTGQLADVRPALAALDLYVHPGEPEPFGLAALEAMAMARPVLGLAHGALPEVVGDDAGLLVPPGDEPALAWAALALLTDPARRQAMGRAGRERAERRFTAGRMAGELETTLHRAAGRP